MTRHGLDTSPSLLLLLLLFFALVSVTSAGDTLSPSHPLTDGETLVSSNGTFVLGFFSPTGSSSRYVGIWFNTNKVSVQTVVWVANRQSPITGLTGALSLSDSNGILSVTAGIGNGRNGNSTLYWSTPAATTHGNLVAQLLEDGNLVVRERVDIQDPGRYLWQSFDHLTDTMLQGMKLGWDLRTGLNRNLTSWATNSDPSPGTYTVAVDIRGYPEAFIWTGGRRTYRSGPFDGVRLSGVPEQSYSLFTFEPKVNAEEVYYSYRALNPLLISRIALNQSGLMQRLVWIEASQTWSVFWYGPQDGCDSLSVCGPYGVCGAYRVPICGCMQGFTPKSPEKWALRDGTDGCVRRTELDCRNGTDGFVTVAGAKLPDTTTVTVNRSMSLERCRTACLANCSCTAYASANISGGGSGCIIWTAEITDVRVYTTGGQDLYVRLAAADQGSSTSSRSKKRVVVMIILGCILGALFLSCIGYCIRKKKRRRTGDFPVSDNYRDESVNGNDLELPLFDLEILKTATDNFCIENKLGEGGFGPVYKGKTEDGQEIAVKRLARTSSQGLEEFKNEVMLIAKLQHRNLVRLLGCCIHGEEKMLVYEYMCNNSLDAFLFDEAKCMVLVWQTRFSIILGIARGLLYLHQDSRFKIIHRDLKTSNILLDKEMKPKISDFGIARIFGGDEIEGNTRKVVGTYGYMSPEYAMEGIFSVKSDVFSFGVVVLEIVSGRKNRGAYKHQQNLIGHAWTLWKENNGLNLVDESIGHSFSVPEILRCIKVGLLCVQERPEDRPTMSYVVLMLGSDGVSSPSPQQPGFTSARGHSESNSSTSRKETINEISLTLVDGR